MKSTSGAYYVGLDHVRALAVFVVWTWHFIQIHELPAVPFFPLSFLTEGHSGVAIFMTLSGYLFAKLLAGKRIDYAAFIANRFWRLAPLLAFVIAIVGIENVLWRGGSASEYISSILQGAVFPTLPNGGWSITVEFHFYLLLPLLLFLQSRWTYALLAILLAAVLFRFALFQHVEALESLRVSQYEHVQSIEHYLAFFTIIGRLDQFLLGILAYQFAHHVRGRHLLAALTALAFLAFQWVFDHYGGYDTRVTGFWAILPTVEGAAFAVLIAWYDTSFKQQPGPVSNWLAAVGTYSYSIYLIHFFIVWELSTLIHTYVCDLSNIYVALAFAVATFPVMVPIASVTYRVIELPFLARRRKYILDKPTPAPQPA